MAYQNNGLKYIDELAKYFGRSSKEDLWNPRQNISRRWSKLVFVYWLSWIVQISVPVGIVGGVYRLVTDQAWLWLFVGLFLVIPGAALVALLSATRVCLRIARERKIS